MASHARAPSVAQGGQCLSLADGVSRRPPAERMLQRTLYDASILRTNALTKKVPFRVKSDESRNGKKRKRVTTIAHRRPDQTASAPRVFTWLRGY